MNKNDAVLIGIVGILAISILMIFKMTEQKGLMAKVYYADELILKIDLKIDEIYEVNGSNGIVKIEVKNEKIRVLEEDSPLHLCSKQGYISKSYETIVCLPNKIVIKLDGQLELDGIVG